MTSFEDHSRPLLYEFPAGKNNRSGTIYKVLRMKRRRFV